MVRLRPIEIVVHVTASEKPKERSFSKEAFLLVAEKHNSFNQPRKPTDGDKKRKNKKKNKRTKQPYPQ